jgi:DNA-binding transcriptional LysR family regulator
MLEDGWSRTQSRSRPPQLRPSQTQPVKRCRSPGWSGWSRPTGSAAILPSVLAELHRHHPGISLELVTTSQLLAYRTGEFDVVVTLHRPEASRFFTRELAEYSLQLYAVPSYLASAPPIKNTEDLAAHEMVWYIDSLVGLPELQFFGDVIASPRFAFRSSNVVAQREAVAAGAGGSDCCRASWQRTRAWVHARIAPASAAATRTGTGCCVSTSQRHRPLPVERLRTSRPSPRR